MNASRICEASKCPMGKIPLELLITFLSAVMLKDFSKALQFCKLVLQLDNKNITANRFYPLLLRVKDFKGVYSDVDSESESSDSDSSICSEDEQT